MSFSNLIFHRRVRRFYSTAFIISLLTFSINGQNKTITFQSLQEGLSQPRVKCILQDRQGFMWFGTQDGLNKFDGTNFMVYEHNPADSNSISYNSINGIIKDKNGRIWVGTSKGLNLYDREKDNFTTIRCFGDDFVNVRSLYVDNKNVLWIGTAGLGLFSYDLQNSEIKQFKHADNDIGSIASSLINCIISDNENNVWIGTRDGLDLFHTETGTFTHFVHDAKNPESLSNNAINALALDKAGNVWVGTYGGGINKIEKRNGKYFFCRYQKSKIKGSISHNNILSLCVDKKGNLWIGTENGGLSCLFHNTDDFVNFYADDGNANSLSSNSIWSIYEDGTGILWIGTYNRGLNIIDRNFDKFELIRRNSASNNSLVNNNVRGFAEDGQGNLWIATDGGGLSCYNLKTHQFVNKAINSKLTNKAVMCVLLDSKQDLWIGTWTGGIDRFDKNGKKIRNYKNEEGLGPGNNIIVLYEDRLGNIWAGTSGKGLFRFDRAADRFKEFTGLDKRKVLSGKAYIRDILEDHNSNLWIGTSFGLACMKRTSRGKYSVAEFFATACPKSISNSAITYLFEDGGKNLWIGTDEGLNRFNSQDKTFSKFSKQDGLPNNKIMGMLQDNNQNIWVSTNKGISKFNPYGQTFENFTKEDGLNSNVFNPRACIKTSSGEFFFGGNNGMNIFYPDSIKYNSFIPPVYITELKIFNNPVKIGAKGSPLEKHITESSEIILSYKQNSFTIEYVALNYTRSEKNQYAFILDGFENNWNFIGNRKTATYTNLSPGKYVFKVKGSNNDHIWNNQPATLKIKIKPPYYKTRLAYILYFFVLILIAIAILNSWKQKLRIKNQLELERLANEKMNELNELNIQFFTDISHEFRTPLSLIIGPLDTLIDSAQSKIKEQLLVIHKNANRLLFLTNSLLDIRKLEGGRMRLNVQEVNVHRFISSIPEYFKINFEKLNIHFSTDYPETEFIGWFDKEKLTTILINLVSNAIKYTPRNGEIHLGVRCLKPKPNNNRNQDKHNCLELDSRILEVCITDSGIGIPLDEQPYVFDKFFQAPQSRKRNLLGSGIGLTLTKGLVELHKGKIWVESQPEKGARFTFIVPIDKNSYKPEEIAGKDFICQNKDVFIDSCSDSIDTIPDNVEDVKKDTRPKVLIVEDNSDLRLFLKHELEKEYFILLASDGEVGLEKAIAATPDLIVSDVVMPRKSGLDLCKELKSDIRTSHIPFILLTAKTTTKEQIEGIGTGADVYLTKPFSLDLLLTQVKNLIHFRRELYARFSKDVYIIPQKIASSELDQEFMQKTIDFILQNITNDKLNVENLASCHNMSHSNVYRKVKALTGNTIVEFIRIIRLKESLKLLEKKKYSIAEISYMTGFSSQAYFTKIFRKQYGMPPSNYIH